jgi:hypothetical protein
MLIIIAIIEIEIEEIEMWLADKPFIDACFRKDSLYSQ